MKKLWLISVLFAGIMSLHAQRKTIPLQDGWRTIASDGVLSLDKAALQTRYNDLAWTSVQVPHNWDQYEGYRRLLHGNRHGEAIYRKLFKTGPLQKGKRYFLQFQGVGSYATVYLNGQKVGAHAGGRTSFSIDVTAQLHVQNRHNVLAVWVGHPAGIKDLPWVCGGCSNERGFSEGSQPMGIFRPVELIITDALRIEPFGIHTWSELDIQKKEAQLHLVATLKNYGTVKRSVMVRHRVLDASGKVLQVLQSSLVVGIKDSIDVKLPSALIKNPHLWSLEDPYLHRIETSVLEKGLLLDQVITPFGFRIFSWNRAHQLEINGKAVFINGIAEYEHLMGKSHAFEPLQIQARMRWIQQAGFNAFRDAHQPHHFLYGQICDEQGLLWWTQFSAHVWYDDPGFKNNFKQLLREWVVERRNEPSLFLWGLQNESQLPETFAKECSDLIRSLDPTASSQRLITTCNGGAGTDWDVPQNWTGTYGGDPSTYAEDLKKQVLVGEYGAWRTLDLHSEGSFQQNGAYSEDRITQLIGQKIALAESVKDSVGGHFFWLLSSHENPGRVQGGEGLRELDRVGPVNYKGLLTPWEEPTDLFYLFRSSYVPARKAPMVYIVSHTWPNRWEYPGLKDGIRVFSNCDAVELFNGTEKNSLGRRLNPGIGKAFQWDQVLIQYNVLYAVGFVDGKAQVRDTIYLNGLPAYSQKSSTPLAMDTKMDSSMYHYVVRVNCGGDRYQDVHGQIWSADRPLWERAMTPLQPQLRASEVWGSSSWTDAFASIPAFFGSQRRIFDEIHGTDDDPLYQDFRYGVQQLNYQFPLPDGNYQVELYFAEPWLGNGGGWNAKGMRQFDVAFNDQVVLKNFDIWSEAGTRKALKKTIPFYVKGGVLKIHFPHAAAGEAVLSAIAIAIKDKVIIPPLKFRRTFQDTAPRTIRASTWADIGNPAFSDTAILIQSLPTALFGADIAKPLFHQTNTPLSFNLLEAADVYVCMSASEARGVDRVEGFLQTPLRIKLLGIHDSLWVYKQRYEAGSRVQMGRENPLLLKWPVLVQVASDLQPAFDLKSVQSFKAKEVTAVPGTEKITMEGKEYLKIVSNDSIEIHWPWKTGVADQYSLTLKYYWDGVVELMPSIALKGSGYLKIGEPAQPFTFTKKGKWNVLNFTTGSMINAGNYEMVIQFKNAQGLIINGIDVQ